MKPYFNYSNFIIWWQLMLVTDIFILQYLGCSAGLSTFHQASLSEPPDPWWCAPAPLWCAITLLWCALTSIWCAPDPPWCALTSMVVCTRPSLVCTSLVRTHFSPARPSWGPDVCEQPFIRLMMMMRVQACQAEASPLVCTDSLFTRWWLIHCRGDPTHIGDTRKCTVHSLNLDILWYKTFFLNSFFLVLGFVNWCKGPPKKNQDLPAISNFQLMW